MGIENDKQIKEDLAALFGQVAEVPVERDPYLATRVMAVWRERKLLGIHAVSGMWRWVAVATTSLSLVLIGVVSVYFLSETSHVAFVNRPFVVKMEVADLQQMKIAKAEIYLPDGVFFDVEDLPELKNRRSLTLKWTNQDSKEFVPFVLTANSEGKKRITVKFYNDAGELVGEKSLEVKLRKAVQNG